MHKDGDDSIAAERSPKLNKKPAPADLTWSPQSVARKLRQRRRKSSGHDDGVLIVVNEKVSNDQVVNNSSKTKVEKEEGNAF